MSGPDPHLISPPVTATSPVPVLVRWRMRSTGDSTGQITAMMPGGARPSAGFKVNPDGAWHDYAVRLPALGAGTRLRIDPSGAPGTLALQGIDVQPIAGFLLPTSSPVPVRGQGRGAAEDLRAGRLGFSQGGERFGDYRVLVDGQLMATGWPAERIGYLSGDRPRWIQAGAARPRVTRAGSTMTIEASLRDAEGGTWTLTRRLRPGADPGVLELDLEIRCSEPRDLIHVPWITLLAGLDTFGTRKHQALLPGVEYLGDEPSSSEADLAPPWNDRLAPHPSKLTIPLLAIQDSGRFLALAWRPSQAVSPVFDSPDRVFGTAAHLMALSGPAVGPLRPENALVAHAPLRLEADRPLRVSARIMAGKAPSVVGALRLWARDHPWAEPTPEPPPIQATLGLLTRGWLDSPIHADGTWEHALGFGHKPSAQATVYLEWLARFAEDPALGERLTTGIQRGRERLGAKANPSARLGETLAPALHGPRRLDGALLGMLRNARRQAGAFGPSGRLDYTPEPGKPDYGRTHFESHANGYGARKLVAILASAAITGDPDLRRSALDLLERQDAQYRHDVPRGAQTWEIPLHTPDILAAALLTHAFVLGYELSGDRRHLEAAVEWAWSGLSFVYLTPPTQRAIGLYATIPVLGATDWDRLNWIGRPVQWCGLVYADALLKLHRHDSSAPWRKIARGIIATGLAMVYPQGSGPLTGLLPDYLDLADQKRSRLSLQPRGIQHNIAELYGLPRIEDRLADPGLGLVIHAAGTLRGLDREAGTGTVEIPVIPWFEGPSWVLVSGAVDGLGDIRVCDLRTNDEPAACRRPEIKRLKAPLRALAVRIEGPSRLRLGRTEAAAP